RELQEIISLLGMDELGASDRVAVGRARRLIRFLTQPFLVTSAFTGQAGVSLALDQTLDGCEAILNGVSDSWPEDVLYMVGSLDDAKRKLSTRTATSA
ncbi:MAG: F0F1 ATP synthase subunit beta, partial [Hyphomicrobiaceae bacterium]|nr:F0F1 ATP synthase subunit beta [Hyphomicrobiaceae bacterium]